MYVYIVVKKCSYIDLLAGKHFAWHHKNKAMSGLNINMGYWILSRTTEKSIMNNAVFNQI
jgi:hypothetical protein